MQAHGADETTGRPFKAEVRQVRAQQEVCSGFTTTKLCSLKRGFLRDPRQEPQKPAQLVHGLSQRAVKSWSVCASKRAQYETSCVDEVRYRDERRVSHWRTATSQPRNAASIAVMSIFFIVIIASNALLAAARSGLVYAFVRAIGVICQEMPHLSLHQPHSLS